MALILNTRIVAIFALAFGLLTIISGGQALFGDDATRDALGAVVPFVLWFNFLAGFAYVAAGIALWLRSAHAVWLATLIATATVAVFVVFAAHVVSGGAYEMRTVGAMALRSSFWIAVAFLAWRVKSILDSAEVSGA